MKQDQIISSISLEEQKALDWWNSLDYTSQFTLTDGFLEVEKGYKLKHYNWIKSIAPKD
jgi:hypothetical protein